MPFANLEGIRIRYEVIGSGPPLLMLAPGGFDATISRWRLNGVWKDLQPLETLTREFRLIAYDRREIGESGGRIEPLTWEVYAREAVALLDHLAIDQALLMGGCMGCAVALAVGARFPNRCRALLMHFPVGGYRWMHKGLSAFNDHIAFTRQHGLAATVERAKKTQSFWRGEPEGGPWSGVIASDPAFAQSFVRQDLTRYLEIVAQSRDNLFSDTMPSGATGEQLMAMKIPAFIMPGDDPAHSYSSAQALRELMPQVTLSPLMPPQQNAATVGEWIRDSVTAARH